MKGTCSAY